MTSRGTGIITLACALAVAGCSGGGETEQATTEGSAQASASPSAQGSSTASTSPTPTPPPTPVAPPASATPLAGKDASALVRIQVNNCTAMTQGTAFFVGPDTVATSGHLFDKASSISVHSASGVVRGALLERDAATGVAVVKVLPTGDGGKLTGAPLPVSAKDPQPSSPVRMLGLPTGRDAHQAKGTVKALDQQATVAENSLSGLVSHDANAQPGVSGAPLLDAAGKVVAMELSTTDDGAGEQHAVPAQAISTVIKQAGSAKPQKLAKCVESGPPSMTSIHPDAPAIKTALTRYLWGLSYPTETDETGFTGKQVAWQGLDPSLQKKHGTADKFIASFKGAKAGAANVDNLEIADQFTDTLLWTVQMEEPGKACRVHHQRVTLSSAPGRWVVKDVTDTEAPRSC